MVEKKSVASLANTFFIVAFLGADLRSWCRAAGGSRPYLALRCSGYHLVK